MAATFIVFTASFAQMVSAESPIPQSFDREACYSTCGCATGMFTSCAECRAACDRKFWKEWDKEMGLDQKPGSGGKKKSSN